MNIRINAISLTIGSQNVSIQNTSSNQIELLDEEEPESSRDEEFRETECQVCLGKQGENFTSLHKSYAQTSNILHQLKLN